MKKLTAILLCLLLLLCACGKAEETPVPGESSASEESFLPEESASQSGAKEEKFEIFKDENGKFGIKSGEDIFVPAEYDSIEFEDGGIYNNTEPYPMEYENAFFVLTKNLEEGSEHDKAIELLSTSGDFAEGGPFDNIMIWGWYSDGRCEISLSKDHSVYGGIHQNGKFDFELIREALDPESTAFGYSIFSQHGVFHAESRGVKNADGEIIIPCKYNIIDIPFPNLAYCNNNCAQTLAEAQSTVFNLETGEVVSECYNFARIYTFDEGYFGVAFAVKPEWGDINPVYLPDGTPTPSGWRFIDKNADEVGEVYYNFDVEDPEFTWQKSGFTLDTVIIATDFEGNTEEFTVRDILIKD